MTPRLLQSPLQLGLLVLSEENHHHLIRVLRCQPGDELVLFDGQGQEARACITRLTPQTCEVLVEQPETSRRESPIETHLVQSLCLGDKMDWVVQKATELGVSQIWPLRASRSQLKLDEARAEKRVAHWQRVAEAAAAQSGRSKIPTVAPIQSLNGLLASFSQHPGAEGLLLDPFSEASMLGLPPSQVSWVAIGPEAGWTDEEEAAFRGAGFLGVRLGPRILRTETVASVALTLMAVRAGEF